MNLVWKFNAALLAIFIVGFALASYVSYQVLQANAREEVLQHARIMMEAASSARVYTNTQVKPLLETQLKYRFLPQSVPAFAATEIFNYLKQQIADLGIERAGYFQDEPLAKFIEAMEMHVAALNEALAGRSFSTILPSSTYVISSSPISLLTATHSTVRPWKMQVCRRPIRSVVAGRSRRSKGMLCLARNFSTAGSQ